MYFYSSSEKVSKLPLELNSCDRQRNGVNLSHYSVRTNGREDYLLMYIESGSCTAVVGGKAVECGMGNVVLYEPNTPQMYFFREGFTTWYFFVHFSGADCARLLCKYGISGGIYSVSPKRNIKDILMKMVDEKKLGNLYCEDVCNGYLMQVLAILGRDAEEIHKKSVGNGNDKNVIDEICRLMDATCEQNYSVSHYSDMCHMSCGRFSHNFKKRTGMSPGQYLIERRIELAKAILLTENIKLSEVSERAGFLDQNYFSRIFKKVTGSTPLKYRRIEKSETGF